jgi:hypothetical protein
MTMRLIACAAIALLVMCSKVEARRHHHGYWDYDYSWDYSPRHHHRKHHRHAWHRGGGSTSLAGVVAPLAAKVSEIAADCGSRIVSAVRHTRVAGTGRMSLHASGRAVDVQGNPSCIYRHLAGWLGQGGGYSRDYGSVRHVHISYGGREAGRTFVHHGRRHYARRHYRWYGYGG